MLGFTLAVKKMTMKEKEERRQAMFHLVEEYLVSGQSQLSFSKKHGIAKSTFQNWCKKYNGQKAPVSKQQPVRHFMPVQVSPSPSTPFSAELAFPNGVCLKLVDITCIDMVKELVNSFPGA